ncbi:hypothetical protein PoB_001371100 [Plakobranchus ocellatus]|uniref:Secreted protein n=1 Tax=Plakobranchus ocellatus TaxID=259542 RepID=A0AAV3YXW3_9GAST|nr:hypothetical protein PoB_001371100 [Plakobranchus ocellatus]
MFCRSSIVSSHILALALCSVEGDLGRNRSRTLEFKAPAAKCTTPPSTSTTVAAIGTKRSRGITLPHSLVTVPSIIRQYFNKLSRTPSIEDPYTNLGDSNLSTFHVVLHPMGPGEATDFS